MLRSRFYKPLARLNISPTLHQSGRKHSKSFCSWPSIMLVRLLSSPGSLAFLSFVAFYLVAILYIHVVSYRDPTSLFFNPRQAYMPAYSTVRQQEAEAFVVRSTDTYTHLTGKPIDSVPNGNKTLCVGIASVARKGARYFRITVGSLLEGLNAKEREEIYLLLFIAHTDPTVHPAYSETWLRNLPNEVLFYNASQQEMKHIARLEHEGLVREKALFDYKHLLKACYEKGLPYIAMLEDDVVAMDGWYHRTIASLKQAETQSALEKAPWDCEETSKNSPFYLQGKACLLFEPSLVSAAVLYGGVPRLEQGRLAQLRILVCTLDDRPCCFLCRSSVLFPVAEATVEQLFHLVNLWRLYTSPDRALLRRRQSHHAATSSRR